MTPDEPKRKPIRLKPYDYAGNGAYLTICTRGKRRILSEIAGDGFHPLPQLKVSPIGRKVESSIAYMNSRYGGIIEKHIVMPNHVHTLVLFLATGMGGHGNPPLQDVVGRIKSFTTKRYNQMMDTENEIL